MRALLLAAPLALAACSSAVPMAKAPATLAKPAAATTQAPKAEARATPKASADDAKVKALARLLQELPPSTARNPPATVRADAFRVEDLPLATLPEPLEGTADADLQAYTIAPELEIDWKGSGVTPEQVLKKHLRKSVRVRISGARFGSLHIKSTMGPIQPTGGGVYISCGGPQSSWNRPMPTRWEILEPKPGGKIELRVTDAWFDPVTCAAHVVARSSALAVPLLPGKLLYAFRQSFDDSRGEFVSVFGPAASSLVATAMGGEASQFDWPFSLVHLPIRQGGSASMLARLNSSSLRAWSTFLELPNANAADLVLGVELSQGVRDPAPLAIAYKTTSNDDPFVNPAPPRFNEDLEADLLERPPPKPRRRAPVVFDPFIKKN